MKKQMKQKSLKGEVQERELKLFLLIHTQIQILRSMMMFHPKKAKEKASGLRVQILWMTIILQNWIK